MIFQLLDADYFVKENRPIIRLFGRGDNGPVCVYFDNFFPYFYAENLNEDKIKDDKRIKDIEATEKYTTLGYHKNPIKLKKVILYNPKDVPVLREELERIGCKTYEADILFKYRFLVDHGISGMDWVEVECERDHTNTTNIPTFHGRNIKKIERDDHAKLKYLSFDIECIMLDTNRPINYLLDPIIMISMAFNPDYRNKKTLVLVAKPTKRNDNVFDFIGEKEMLEEFLKIIDEYDPDIITGYNINNFDLPYILKRLEKYKLNQNFGRVRNKAVFTKTFGQTQDTAIVGRVVFDPYQILKRDPFIRLQRYSLDNVAKVMLGDKKIEIDHKDIHTLWEADNLDKLIQYAEKDAELALRLVLEKGLMNKFLELSRVSGLLLQDSFGGQTMRIEVRILHEARKNNFVIPNKPDKKEINRRNIEREKKELKGAFVLEPDKGLHSSGCTLVLDFQSLYPSLIMAYNISPECVISNPDDIEVGGRLMKSPTNVYFVDKGIREGMLPKILRDVLDSRFKAKKEMKNATGEMKRILDAKQQALKIMANSFYGYTGYVRARMYMIDVASSITAYGRENILKTKKMIEEKFSVKVIYMDTDSAFVKTDITELEKAEKLGNEISAYVTGELKNLRLEFEKIYKTFLILTKKRYAGWKFYRDHDKWIDEIETRGIETVRRDWCPLVSQTLENVINIILKEGDVKKAIDYVKNIFSDIQNNRVPLDQLTVVKGITKNIESYEGTAPHIELARKLKKRNPQSPPAVGDRVPFVIIKGNQLLSKRAEDPRYVAEHNLQIDSDYYTECQLFPPIERILSSLGITKSEIMGNGHQVSIHDIFLGRKNNYENKKKDEVKEIKLDGIEDFVCQSCKKSYRRMPLSGHCECGGKILFAYHGNVGEKVIIEK